MSTVLWEELERIGRWQRENLPTIDTRPGMALLIWLLKNERQPRPIGELYKSSRNSEPTMRACVKAFVSLGLASAEAQRNDTRRRLLCGTDKLERTVDEYKRRLAELGQASTATSSSPST